MRWINQFRYPVRC